MVKDRELKPLRRATTPILSSSFGLILIITIKIPITGISRVVITVNWFID
jgi:hypothetical protein